MLVMDMSIEFCGVKFPNPTVLASGVLGVTSDSWKNVSRKGAGGITTKSIWKERNEGHSNPTMLGNDHYFINAVGLPDAGMEKAIEEIGKWYESPPEHNGIQVPLIANIVGGTMDDFVHSAEEVSKLNPDIVEVNISCPNVEDEHGKPFACVADDAAEVTKRVREVVDAKIPVIVKLSPNVEDVVSIAKAVEAAGADGLCAFNTYGPAMAIDIETAEPILANKVGGLSGPAIKSMIVKNVYELYSNVKIPILGTGGVTSGEDAIELMMAGARLIGVGTACYYRGDEALGLIAKEIQEWCDAHGYKSLEEVIGLAHKQ